MALHVTLGGGFLRGQLLHLKITIWRRNFARLLIYTTKTAFSIFSCDILKLFYSIKKQIALGSIPTTNTLKVSHIQYKIKKKPLK